jgi:ubiquinone/menaquinone biosynthesis C-methylase UbiE
MSLFKLKKSGGPRDLEVSMAGLKLGSRVLQIDGGDGELMAAMAKVVGLSGQACALVQSQDDAEPFTKAAGKAGVLVEVKVGRSTSLPFDDGSFDVVVIREILGRMRQNDRVITLQQTRRVLRVGGRCLVIEQSGRGGLGALFSRQTLDHQYMAGGARSALQAEGFRGVRVLSERDGVSFTEGSKAADPTGL